MKPTLEIDDQLLARARKHAAMHGTTLREIIEESLRASLAPRPGGRVGYQFSPPVVRGTRAPVIEVSDRDALYDLFDGRP